MIHKGWMEMGLVLSLLSVPLFAQGRGSALGDDYSRAALRAVIYSKEGSTDAQFIQSLLIEADVAASTPAEEASLKELNRILGNWFRSPSNDHQACYLALKTNLKARKGETPEACR